MDVFIIVHLLNYFIIAAGSAAVGGVSCCLPLHQQSAAHRRFGVVSWFD